MGKTSLFEQSRCPDGTWAPESGDCDDHGPAEIERADISDASYGDGEDFHTRSISEGEGETAPTVWQLSENPRGYDLPQGWKDYVETRREWKGDLSSDEAGGIHAFTRAHAGMRAILQGGEPDEFDLEDIFNKAFPDLDAQNALVADALKDKIEASGQGLEEWMAQNLHEVREVRRGIAREWAEKVTRAAVQGLERAPKRYGTAYRGIAIDDESLKHWKPGRIVRTNNLDSYTTLRAIADDFSTSNARVSGGRKTATVLEVEDHEGVDVSDMSGFPGESEVVSLPGRRYEIVDVGEPEPNPYNDVDVRTIRLRRVQSDN